MRVLILLLSLLFLFSFPSTSAARTWHVPSEAPTIQAGIDAASPGDTALVAPGTYSGEGNRDIDFGGKGLVLKSEDGPGGTIIDCEGTEAEPHRGLIFHSGETSAALVDGFTIRNGYAVGESPANLGGAVYCRGSSPSFLDCIFSGNYATAGGGMSCSYSSPTLTGCTFAGDSAGYRGGGLYADGFSQTTVIGCTFSENSAPSEGGGMWFHRAMPTFTDCTFQGNSATYANGGGVYLWDSDPHFQLCTFTGNSALSYGGAVYSRIDSDPIFSSCVFSGNSASWGGAISTSDAWLTVVNCTFFGNSAYYGGGLYFSSYYGTPMLEELIIAFGTGGGGVACHPTSRTPVFSCCDIYGNVGGDWAGCIAGQDTINGNFSADPLFCDAANGDFRLGSESPCVIPQLDPACGEFIGAWGVGCGSSEVTHPRTSGITWGGLRTLLQLPRQH